eukprot:1475097-Pleurochrysis_carterae.AAC.1
MRQVPGGDAPAAEAARQHLQDQGRRALLGQAGDREYQVHLPGGSVCSAGPRAVPQELGALQGVRHVQKHQGAHGADVEELSVVDRLAKCKKMGEARIEAYCKEHLKQASIKDTIMTTRTNTL